MPVQDPFASLVSAEVPDPSRERVHPLTWDAGRQLLRVIRAYQATVGSGPAAMLRRRRLLLQHRFWSTVAGADIPINVSLGVGLLLPHPNGIVIHPEAVVGPNCLLFQQVSLGTTSRPGAPILGGHVDVGAGAKVLGPVRIGNHVRIGANSVVLSDVPDGATVVGAPARIVRRLFTETCEDSAV